MTNGPDPGSAPPGPRPGRSLVRWSSAVVAIALLVAGSTAFLSSRGNGEQSDDVTFVPSGVTGSATASPSATGVVAAGDDASASASPSATEATGVPTASATDTVEATSTPADAGATTTPTAEPTPAPTEAPPLIALNPEAVGIGETMAVRVYAPQAGGGSVVAAGASFPLLPEADGFLFGVIGVPLNAALGPADLALTLRDDFGTVIEERSVPYEVTTVDRPIDYLELTEEQGAVLTAEAAALERTLRTEQFLTFDRERRWSGLFRMPTQGIQTTAFGQGRSINGGPVGGFHSGADIANEAGTPVQAAAAGRVAWAGEMPIRGNTVIVDHGAGVKTGYHHLQAILVEVGQEVGAGQQVGEMGSTGLSTGPHLHWELTIYGVNVDPLTWTTVDFTG